VEKGDIKFDPPLEERQWGEASIDLRLGFKFTKFWSAKNVKFSMAGGIEVKQPRYQKVGQLSAYSHLLT